METCDTTTTPSTLIRPLRGPLQIQQQVLYEGQLQQHCDRKKCVVVPTIASQDSSLDSPTNSAHTRLHFSATYSIELGTQTQNKTQNIVILSPQSSSASSVETPVGLQLCYRMSPENATNSSTTIHATEGYLARKRLLGV